MSTILANVIKYFLLGVNRTGQCPLARAVLRARVPMRYDGHRLRVHFGRTS